MNHVCKVVAFVFQSLIPSYSRHNFSATRNLHASEKDHTFQASKRTAICSAVIVEVDNDRWRVTILQYVKIKERYICTSPSPKQAL